MGARDHLAQQLVMQPRVSAAPPRSATRGATTRRGTPLVIRAFDEARGTPWWPTLLLLAPLWATSCAVFGVAVPCEATRDCPSGECVDGTCTDGECIVEDTFQRCDERDIPCAYQKGVVVAEGTGKGCVGSVEDALDSDASRIWIAAGTWRRPAAAWRADGQTIGAAGGVTLEGAAPLFEIGDGGLTLEGVAMNVDAPGPAIAGSRAAELHVMPALTLVDVEFADGARSVALEEIALHATRVEFGAYDGVEPGVVAVSTVDGFDVHELFGTTFDRVGARFDGPNRVMLQGSSVIISTQPFHIAASATVDTTTVSAASSADCAEAFLLEGGFEDRSLSLKQITFGALPAGCVALRVRPATGAMFVDLGAATALGPEDTQQGDNTFASAPGLIVENRPSNAALAFDAQGNTWSSGADAACGTDIIVQDTETTVWWGPGAEDYCPH